MFDLPAQIRVAIGFLQWTRRQLARHSKVCPNVVTRALREPESANPRRQETLVRLKAACEEAGFSFSLFATQGSTAR